MTQGKLRKEAGVIGLLYASVGGIVGSGWLFGPLHAAQQAGPLSLGSWLIGAVAVLLIALVFAELATLIPRSGALVHISRVSHGAFLGVIWSWILFFAYVSVAPVEVMAVLTYANNYLPGLIHPGSGLLTSIGFVVSIVLLAVFVALNFLVVRWVLLINSTATWWKLAVPAATVVVLLALSFHPENLHIATGRSQQDVAGMFTAVATSGVIFSYFGFRQAIDLAGETPNPSRNVPIAVIGSVFIAALLYIALQFAFLLAVDPAALASGGWATLKFAGSTTGPFAAIATVVGAAWWAVVLYIDAIVSPAGTAFIYTTAASRVTMATGEIGSGPRWLARINRNGTPWAALLVTFVVGALFFFPFPSWQKLVSYISSVTVLSFSIGPIVLLQLRRSMPDAPRPFRLWAPWVIAPAAYIISNWIIYWTGVATLDVLFGMLAVVFVGYLIHHYLLGGARRRREPLGWAHVWWLLPYFAGLWGLTELGPHAVGGNGAMTLFEGMAAVAVFSIVILGIALATAVPQHDARHVVEEMVELPPEAVLS
ncbi:MAG: APC family permease [Proteobacteria bacterium]|nr:APC family permease [Pseudomonadota bacterium]